MASKMVLIITVSVQLFLQYENQLLIAMHILCIKPIKSMLVESSVLEVAQLEAKS
jgi:hypothetical protein